MKQHTQQILNLVQRRQPIEAREIKKVTNLDISQVHSSLRELHQDGKVKKVPVNRRRRCKNFTWEVV